MKVEGNRDHKIPKQEPQPRLRQTSAKPQQTLSSKQTVLPQKHSSQGKSGWTQKSSSCVPIRTSGTTLAPQNEQST